MYLFGGSISFLYIIYTLVYVINKYIIYLILHRYYMICKHLMEV
nr:MAG TPA: hypothetical protein [Caudoviricetes sp.]